MAVHNPTKGDLWDRSLILELKIANGWAEGKKVDHFREEKAAIDAILADTLGVPGLGKIVRDYRRVQQHLWDAADRQAKVKSPWTDSPFELAMLMMELSELNQRRTAFKEQIEKLLGEWKGPDKI